jgi:tetratricopeptide (TPR) repeat protein
MKTLINTLLLLCSLELSAQFQFSTLRLPDASPKSWVGHRVGITDIMVEYYSPRTNEREVWGKLVPYDRVWRAGANENTVISYSDTVKINGSLLPPGKYGLHMIPAKEGEWTIIFSRNSTSWGSFTYSQAEDALRVKSKPVPSEKQNEWLRYEFTQPSENSVVLSLAWEKLKVPFTIEVNVHRVVVQKFRQEYLRGVSNFDWTSWHHAAGYWFQNRIDDREALQLINRSIRNGSSFANNSLKASILGRMGNKADSISARQMAIAVGNIGELDGYARNVLLRNKKVIEAMHVFTENARRHPGIWPTDAGLARGYSAQGNYKEALKYARKALTYAQSQPDKQAWEAAIKFWTESVTKLEKKKDIN